MSRALFVIALGIVALGVTLGVYVGSHLSNEAMSVLAGAACGAGAVLPAAIIAGLILLRRREREDVATRAAPPPQSPYPPMIIVAPPAMNPSQSPNSVYAPIPPVAPPRQFTVIGDDPLDSSV